MTRPAIAIELTPVEAALIVGLFNKEFESISAIAKFMEDSEKIVLLTKMTAYKSIVDKIKDSLDDSLTR